MTPGPHGTVAVLVVREGVPPVGAGEAIAEADGTALLVGSGCERAVAALPELHGAWCAEVGEFAPGAWARALAVELRECDRLILPASADGRDLAPRLAAALDRPLLAGATRVLPHGAELLRHDGALTVAVDADGPFVATLLPSARGTTAHHERPTVSRMDIDLPPARDVEVLEVLEPDPSTADLAETPAILGAGAGLCRGDLSAAEAIALLERTAAALGASLGATRVVTDAGWVPPERQIGTTGVQVDPRLYVAFGVSGALQHTGGLGDPEHVVSINTDASSPMTEQADLGLVTDAVGLLQELAARLGIPRTEGSADDD